MHSESKYINRELSWLEFNQRVLNEARDPEVPLLERLKFLAITASNLDEFFMVRVGGLQMLVADGKQQPDPSGLTTSEQLAAIRQRVLKMNAEQYHCLQDELFPEMSEIGIHRADMSMLNQRQLEVLTTLFDEEIHSVISPVAIDEEFPLMANGLLYACVRLRSNEDDLLSSDGNTTGERFVVIRFEEVISRFHTIPTDEKYQFVLLEDIVEHFASRYFQDQEILEFVPFRVVRNADIALQEDGAADLMSEMTVTLDARTESSCVRLEIGKDVGSATLEFLTKSLEIQPEQIFHCDGPLDLSDFMELSGINGFDYAKFERWPPQPSPEYDKEISAFKNIRRGDILLSHPYHSFDPVVSFVNEAADDPDVLAIKQTLYRVGGNSGLVSGLIRAAENGKSVTVIVELKARFDERRNIHWARQLEQSGATVLYGVKGLKTHAKVCMVVRRDPDGVRRYCHFGTGNYNESTAKIYGDISLLTCDEELGADATDFFNAVTGYSQPNQFRKIEAAPIGLRERLTEMIDVEIQQAQNNHDASITAKFNSLTDLKIINQLYAASQAGVKIQLNIRGICCLRPGVPGLSDNIHVVSIVDRFLEHARIIHFHHGGDERIFISSADWMRRNLSRRVELLVPVDDQHCKEQLIELLGTYFEDNQQAAQLLPDGTYAAVEPESDREADKNRSQETLYHRACEMAKLHRRGVQMMLEPHFSSGR